MLGLTSSDALKRDPYIKNSITPSIMALEALQEAPAPRTIGFVPQYGTEK
jgi:hypothetical protein